MPFLSMAIWLLNQHVDSHELNWIELNWSRQHIAVTLVTAITVSYNKNTISVQTNTGTETHDKAAHTVVVLSNIDRSKVGYPH